MEKSIFRIYKRGAAVLIGFEGGEIVPRQTDITIKQSTEDMKLNRAVVEWSSFVFGPDLTDPEHHFYTQVLDGKQFDGLLFAEYKAEDIDQHIVKLSFNFKAYAFISGETYNANLPIKEI